jgi:uncharacterized protein YxjI
LHDTLIIRDREGAEVAKVQRQLVALRPTYHITRPGAGDVAVRKHLISPFVDRYTVDLPGPHDLQVTGSLLEHEYTIKRDGEIVARVSKRWISITETYGVEITAGEDDLLILAAVLALDLAEDREREHDQHEHREHENREREDRERRDRHSDD